MKRRSAGSTAALLQRASTQLKGERVVQASEEDDLQAYINSLSKRTAPKKSLSFDEDSEISISNEDFQYGGADMPVPASRYLKKKGDVRDSLDSVESIGPGDPIQQRFLKKKLPGPGVSGTSPVPAVRPSTARGSSRNSAASSGFGRPVQRHNPKSSILNKAEALATKITQRPAPTRQSNVFTLDTDSEDSPRKPVAAPRSVHSRSPSPMRSASDSSMSLGRDGGKFVKRKSDPPPPPDFLTSQKAAKSEQKRVPKPSPRSSVNSAKGERKLLGKLMLSSEEESLAEFIDGLSGSEVSMQRSSSPGKRGGGVPVTRSPSPEQKPLGRTQSPSKHSPFKRTSSPPSISRLHARSMSDESLQSDAVYTHADTVSIEEEDGQFNVNVVMDLDTLGPVMSLDLENETLLQSPTKPAPATPTPSPFFKTQSGTPSKQKKSTATKSDKYSIKKSTQKESKSKGIKQEKELLSNFGLHTVDELMGTESKTSKDSSKDMSVVSDISEILTDKPSNVFKAKPVQDSITEGLSEVEARADVEEQYSYSQQFDSISEKIGEDSSRGQSASEVETQYSGDDSKTKDKTDYTEDFTSGSETDVESYSDSYTSNTDSKTYSYTRSVSQLSGNAVSKKSVEVQTGDQPGLTYQWNTHHGGMAFMGPSFGLSYPDPSPIATHTVSPEALEALTTYSPAMLALHDMLKQQLELTQTFIQAQQYLYSSYTRSIEPEHKYTTLEDTKQYIKKHRKPRLTFKEALKLVDREMT